MPLFVSEEIKNIIDHDAILNDDKKENYDNLMQLVLFLNDEKTIDINISEVVFLKNKN